MTRRLRGATFMGLILLVTACGARAPSRGPAPDGAFALAFEDEEAPGIFTREAIARRDRPKGTQGLWATVPGLRRPERAEVVNVATGASVTVALFSGRGPANEIRLSNAAAEIIGIGTTPQAVKVTALRRETVLVTP